MAKQVKSRDLQDAVLIFVEKHRKEGRVILIADAIDILQLLFVDQGVSNEAVAEAVVNAALASDVAVNFGSTGLSGSAATSEPSIVSRKPTAAEQQEGERRAAGDHPFIGAPRAGTLH